MKVEKSFGLSWMSVSLIMLIYPFPLASLRIRSRTSKDSSPKKRSAPCCSSSIIFLNITPVEAVDMAPYSFSSSSFPSPVRYCITFRMSLRSMRPSWLSSQYLKMIDMIPAWVSFRSRIREKSTGPNSETVARSLTPFCSEIVRSSTGKPIVE